MFDCRYASNTIDHYLAGLTHFAHWLTESPIDVKTIDEGLIQHFLDDHLPSCCCEQPAFSNANDLHAALGHLLRILRTDAIIADPSIGQTPIDEELRRFDDHMNHVRGLAAKTRNHYLSIVHCLLLEQFADQAVVIAAIKPEQIRQFIASQRARCAAPASISAPVLAFRSYFRYRTTLGDSVHHLIDVTCFPANWQQATLPKTLTKHEVERLLSALVHDGPAATITLHSTKGRREAVMPLPAATGQAIANYLRHERPPTSKRAVFVRNVAPRDQPVGPDLCQTALKSLSDTTCIFTWKSNKIAFLTKRLEHELSGYIGSA